MARLVAFLRAINVGGRTVSMADLRRHFGDLGLRDVETFIASGNVIFTSSANGAALERKIEKRLEDELGYEVATFVRTADRVAAIATREPFPAARLRAAGAFCVGFLRSPLDGAARKALATLESDVDSFACDGSEVYWLCRVRQSESKFNNNVFEKATKAKVTFRGMPTLAKLAAKLGGAP